MFAKHENSGYEATPLQGIRMKTLCYGAKTLMTEFLLDAGSVLPAHDHPHEQTGYLVRGQIILTIDGKEHDVSAGDSWAIPSNIEHGARILEDSIAIEVFSPVRKDYLP